MDRAQGLEHLTLLGLEPPEFVSVAAAAGFGAVGLRISPAAPGEEPWPMLPGSPMLAETVRRCAQAGVQVLDEAIRLGPEPDGWEPVLQAAAELGARYVNAVCEDPDLERLSDHFGELVRAARPFGVRPVIEFMTYRSVRTLADAVAIAALGGRRDPGRRAARAAVRRRPRRAGRRGGRARGLPAAVRRAVLRACYPLAEAEHAFRAARKVPGKTWIRL
jgi:hypothetical protein